MAEGAKAPAGDSFEGIGGWVFSIAAHTGLSEEGCVAGDADVEICFVEGAVEARRRGEDYIGADIAIDVDGEIVVAVA